MFVRTKSVVHQMVPLNRVKTKIAAVTPATPDHPE